MRKPHSGWRRKAYALVHVLPDGSCRPAGVVFQSWPDALARAELLVDALQAELERGNPDAGGAVWVINADNGTIARQFVIRERKATDR